MTCLHQKFKLDVLLNLCATVFGEDTAPATLCPSLRALVGLLSKLPATRQTRWYLCASTVSKPCSSKQLQTTYVHPYQQGQGSLKSCSSLFRPIWPAIRAATLIIQAATARQVPGEQVSRHSHAWVTVIRIALLIMTPSAFSVAEAVCVNSHIDNLSCMYRAIASKVIPLKLLQCLSTEAIR